VAETKGVRRGETAEWYDTKVELHWYEASGIGKKEFKIKRFVD
jgi:hypothetical protein